MTQTFSRPSPLLVVRRAPTEAANWATCASVAQVPSVQSPGRDPQHHSLFGPSRSGREGRNFGRDLTFHGGGDDPKPGE